MKNKIRWVWIAVALAFIAGGVWWWSADSGTRGVSYRTAKVDSGEIAQTVSATGRLSARVTVDVGSQVSGQIAEIAVDFNSLVKKGDLLARIDDSVFKARAQQAAAELTIASANLASARAAREEARVNAVDAERSLKRASDVRSKGLISESDLDAARLRAEQARARTQSAEAGIAQAQAQIVQRQASLDAASADLERTLIRSPVDGIVIARNVSSGQTVAASLQAPVLFTIAEDLKRMQLEASIDEADIGAIRSGQTVRFSVDAFANARFTGEVEQIRKLATLLLNVVTYTVVISAENPDLKLLPGMTANLNLVIDERSQALRVPNAALRFNPPAGAAVVATAQAAPAAPPAAGQQPGERMVAELGLDPSQAARLRQIMGGMRGEMAAIAQSNPTPDERRTRMQGVFANAAMALKPELAPAQQEKLDQWLAERGRASGNRARVFIQTAQGLKPILLKIGISDGSQTEVLEGLTAGQDVVIGVNTARPRA